MLQKIPEVQSRLQEVHYWISVHYEELATNVEILHDNLYWLPRQNKDAMRGREGNGCEQKPRSRYRDDEQSHRHTVAGGEQGSLKS